MADNSFPRPATLGGGRAVDWLESENANYENIYEQAFNSTLTDDESGASADLLTYL